MPVLSARSRAQLTTAHKDLRRLIEALVEDGVALEVICGFRPKAEQDRLFLEKKSRLKFPKSKHNRFPALAVDVCPVPIDWKNLDAFRALAARVLAKAKELEIKVRWGADWSMDGSEKDEKFLDYVHFELL